MAGESSLRAILDSLLRHPISRLFTRSQLSALPDVTVPMDLDIISSKLAFEKYSLAEFRKDILLIQSNFNSAHGEGTAYSRASAHLVSLFEKEVRLRRPLQDDWSLRVVSLQREIATRLKMSPAAVSPPSGLDLTKPIRTQLVSTADIKNFISAAKKLTAPSEISVMVDIIEKNQPGLLPRTARLTIDMTAFKPTTLRELIGFAKQLFEKRGIPYPNDGNA
jgi:hypothetical protein